MMSMINVVLQRAEQEPSSSIVCQREVLSALGLQPGDSIEVALGQATQTVVVKESAPSSSAEVHGWIPVVYLCANLFADFDVEGLVVGLQRMEGMLRLGLFVGVFMNPWRIASIANGRPHPFIQNHALASETEQCVSCFFTLDDVNENDLVAWVWVQNQWQRRRMPLPHVMYDRASGFKPADKPAVKQLRQDWQQRTFMVTINQAQYIGKWQFYRALRNNERLQPYLPETRKYESFEDVREMLTTHSDVFVKSYYGSLATEVIAIQRLDDGTYRVSRAPREGHLEQTSVPQLTGLESILKRVLLPEKRYIVQQGITLQRWADRCFDVRVLMIKNRKGEWQSAYELINLAQPDSPLTTVLATEDYSYRDLQESATQESALQSLPDVTALHECALQICETLEQSIGTMGEIGLDLAIDVSGRIWVLEANAKPEKYPGPGLPHQIERATEPFCLTLQYAKYLTDGPIAEDEYLGITQLQRNQKDDCIRLPRWLWRKLRKKLLTIKLGAHRMTVPCRSHAIDESVRLPGSLCERFDGLAGTSCHMKWDGTTLHFGPWIGMFISLGFMRKIEHNQPHFRQLEFAHAAQAQNVPLYFFSNDDVDLVKGSIRAYLPADSLPWRRGTLPLPDLLYDRGGGTLPFQQKRSWEIRSALRALPGLQIINAQHYFHKWNLYEQLRRRPGMRAYLPMTKAFESSTVLREMIRRYRRVYLKDGLGSNGRGVMRIVQRGHRLWSCSFVVNRRLHVHRIRNWPHVLRLVKRFFRLRSLKQAPNLIVQQAIPLMRHHGRLVDMRATLQRNERGELTIVSCPVRVGRKNAPVTSSLSGSSIYTLEQFFIDLLHRDERWLAAFEQRVRIFLLRCYHHIEAIYGRFAEIGIDFAIDRAERLYFIECNAKPGYNCAYQACDRHTILQTFSNPIGYARRITGFIANDN